MKKLLITGLVLTLSTSVAMAQSLSGQAQMNVENTYEDQRAGWFFGDTETQTITLEPGRGVFGIDDLSVGDRMQITLINPTNMPLRFQTTKRLGNEMTYIVPPNSSRTIAFTYTNPVKDEVEFFVTQEPSAGVAAVRGVTEEQSVIESQNTSSILPQHSDESQMQQQQPASAPVRGYW